MNAHIEPQVIEKDGKPIFAVIPWNDYQQLIHAADGKNTADVWFPNDVVKANVRGDSLIKAWREHFGLTQAELAATAGMKQPALARLEKTGSARTSTLRKLADAMDISVEQLLD